MSKSHKIIFVAVGGSLGFFLLTLISLTVLLNAADFKSRMETLASNSLEMEATFAGKMKVRVFPSLRVTLNDVHFQKQGVDVASAKQLVLEIEFWPLLRRDLRFKEIVLFESIITIAKDDQGKFNFQRTQFSPGSLRSLNIPQLSLRDATLIYVDKLSNQHSTSNDIIAKNCRVDVYGLLIAANNDVNSNEDQNSSQKSGQNNIQNDVQDNRLRFSSQLECGELTANGYQVSNLKLEASKDAKVLKLRPIALEVFGAEGFGTIDVDFSRGAPHYQVQFTLPQFPIESFFKSLKQGQETEQPALGNMDFSAGLSMQGKSIKELTQSASGNLSLRGENLTLMGTDLDDQFADFESSQHFSLVDVGAFFYAGPLGLFLTKGYDFSGILLGSGGQSEISSLVSEWTVESGVAKAVDVAMATKRNRIALHGDLDFVNARYNDVTLAVIDAEGCVAAQQKVNGDFLNPDVKQPNIFKSLAGPVINLLEEGRDLLSGGECEVFYEGSVVQPK